MGNEVSSARQMLAHSTLDVVCGAVTKARAALGIPGAEQFTLALLWEEGKRHRFELALAAWRAEQTDEAGDVLDQFLNGSA
jgi:hypothetical protein